MTYQSRLHPWLIYRQLPNSQNTPVARFRRRGDAEMYLITVKRLIPDAQFIIAFDTPQSRSDRPQSLDQPDKRRLPARSIPTHPKTP